MTTWPFYTQLDPDVTQDREDDAADYVATFGEAVRETRPFLNIGAGKWTHPLWQNHDFVQPPYDKFTPPDLNIDLSVLEPLPVPDESYYLLYTCHTVEHLTKEMMDFWFAECCRILKPGGVLRVVTPDIETAYWAYLTDDLRYYNQRYTSRMKEGGKPVMASSFGFGKKQSGVARNFLARFASCLNNPATIIGPDGTPMDAEAGVHAWFKAKPAAEAYDAILEQGDFATKKPGQHINWYTGEKLSAMLTSAGFDYAVRTSYGQSVCPLMRNKFYFDRTRPNESIYMDAIKAHPDIILP